MGNHVWIQTFFSGVGLPFFLRRWGTAHFPRCDGGSNQPKYIKMSIKWIKTTGLFRNLQKLERGVRTPLLDPRMQPLEKRNIAAKL